MWISSHLESRMLSPKFRWFLIIFLIAIIFFNGELGRALGDTEYPLPISVVWPATGFSLAAVLIFGYKVWPGIFFGNFLYNYYNYTHLHTFDNSYPTLLIICMIISFGSLLQALVAAFIMRRFSSANYFYTVTDIFVFLLPSGILACMIASTIGVAVLYLTGTITSHNFISVWLNFWLGDNLGVYIFTPLLVVWTLHSPEVGIKEYPLEAFFMIFFIIALAYLGFIKDYPIVHLFIPLSLWITYRFRMHGATLAIFVITLIAIIPTALGTGSLVTNLVHNQLVILVSFLEVIVATCLIVAAIANERMLAMNMLKKHNLNLQDAIEVHRVELKKMYKSSLAKEKLTSYGALSSSVTKHLLQPLKRVRLEIENSIKNFIQLEKSHPADEMEQKKYLKDMFQAMQSMSKLDKKMTKFIKIFERELEYTQALPDKTKIATVNLHTLLNTCISNTFPEEVQRDLSIIKEFDNAVAMMSVLPEDLMHAFDDILENALESMNEKQQRLGENYHPALIIRTKDHHDKVEIAFRDNGEGVEQEKLYKYSQNESLPAEDAFDIKLAISRDIIVHIHHGELHVDSVKGEYCQVIILLPKLTLKRA